MTADVVERIDTFLLRTPTAAAFYSSQGRFEGRKSLLVRVTTRDGIVGWGESGQYGPAEPAIACIEHVLAPIVVGSVTTPQLAWERMYAAIRDFGARGPYMEAMSGIDIALWDIAGKRHGVPVAELIGGLHRDSVPTYGTGFYYPAADPRSVDLGAIRAEAQAKRADGFDTVKAKVGFLDVADDARRLHAVHEGLDGGGLAVDSNHAYDLASARRMAGHLRELDALWFEEPVVPEDRAAYRRLRADGDVPIAGGECEFTRFGFAELIEQGCVDIAQPDLGVMGGISEWTHVRSIASVHGTTVMPHVWGSAIALAAALQVLAATPLNPFTANSAPFRNEAALEFDTTHNPLRADIVAERFDLVDGRVAVPTGPGLGMTVDEDALASFVVGAPVVVRA